MVTNVFSERAVTPPAPLFRDAEQNRSAASLSTLGFEVILFQTSEGCRSYFFLLTWEKETKCGCAQFCVEVWNDLFHVRFVGNQMEMAICLGTVACSHEHRSTWTPCLLWHG